MYVAYQNPKRLATNLTLRSTSHPIRTILRTPHFARWALARRLEPGRASLEDPTRQL